MKYAVFTNSFKKNLRINNNYLILLASVLFFTTCIKKNVAPKPLETIATVKAKIEGTWQMVKLVVAVYNEAGTLLRNDTYSYINDGRNWDFHPEGTCKMEACGYDGFNQPGVYSDTDWSLLTPSEIKMFQVEATITTLDEKNFSFTTKKYKKKACPEIENHIATYHFTR